MKRFRQSCELCKGEATVYCDADSANLCWSCDAAVHGANFLVARHVRRRLLLASCCSPAAIIVGPASCGSDRAGRPASPSSSSCVSSSESTAAASTAKRRRRRFAAAGREGMPARVDIAGEVCSAVKGGGACESVLKRREARLVRPAEEGWAEC